MNDDKIKKAIMSGDELAMDCVMRKYSRLLWYAAGRALGDIGTAEEIEECVADAFVYLWQHPERFDPARGTLKSWLAIIARSRAADRARQIARRGTVQLGENVAADDEPLDELLISEERGNVQNAVGALREPDREIIVRRYYSGQKPGEIALAMDMSVSQVNNRLYRAKKQLKSALGEMEENG